MNIETIDTRLTIATLSKDEATNLIQYCRDLPPDHPAKPAAVIIADDLAAALAQGLPINTGILLLIKPT